MSANNKSELDKGIAKLNRRLEECEDKLLELSVEFGEDISNSVNIDRDILCDIESYNELGDNANFLKNVAWFIMGVGVTCLCLTGSRWGEIEQLVLGMLISLTAGVVHVCAMVAKFKSRICKSVCSAAIDLKVERKKVKFALKYLNKVANADNKNNTRG